VKLPLQLALLAVLAVLMQVCDLVTATQMVLQQGPQAELNPLVRGVYVSLGPLGLWTLKLAPVGMILSLGGLGLARRPILVRNLLVLTVMLGAVATESNLA
jgi:hypothetical protein